MNTRYKQSKTSGLLAALLCLVVLVFSVSPALAASTAKSSAPASGDTSTITGDGSVKGYAADSDLQYGTIVQLDEKNNQKVLPVTQKNAQQMYGVVVDPHLLSITFSNSKYAHEVYVATSGNYNALVGTQNGAIKSGDYLEMSSVDGVAMNAGDSSVTVLGRALSGFDGKQDAMGSTTLKDSTGKTVKRVYFGTIPVAIDIQHNPNEKSTKLDAPNILQQIGQQVANRPVTPIKMYLSIAIVFLSLVVAAVILYSGIRSGMISLGRNPLSKKTILRGLIEVVLAAIVILIIGLFAVYLLLKL